MTSARQQVLVLHLNDGDLGSTTVAWAFYDGTLSADDVQMQAVTGAKCRCWTGQLANEYWLERIQDNDSHEGG